MLLWMKNRSTFMKIVINILYGYFLDTLYVYVLIDVVMNEK